MDTPGAPARDRARPGALAVAAVALAHVAAVAPRYRFGSFDDDASYVLVARALAHGAFLGSRLFTGVPLVAAYPPGYAALLAPLARVSGDAVAPYRALSVVATVALFPVLWWYLAGRGVAFGVRLGALVLLALNPVLATFGSMVMAEVPFLVVVVVFCWAGDRWAAEEHVPRRVAVAAVLSAAGLVWLKEAGIGLAAGLVVWLVVKGRLRRAAVAAVALVVLLAPLAAARSAMGTPVLGSRYSSEIGGPLSGGIGHRLSLVLPHLGVYVTTAIPRSLVPPGSPFHATGALHVTLVVVGWAATAAVAIGFVSWCRRAPGVACAAVPLYLAETLVYPYINERRVLLVLPLVATWAALGAAEALSGLRSLAGRAGPARAAVTVASAGLAVGLVGWPLVAQFPRDYLFALHQRSSAPAGSTYMTLLGQLGSRADPVETDYLWSTALLSGHRTVNGAFLVGQRATSTSVVTDCQPGPVADALSADRPTFVLSAALDNTGGVDSDCVLGVLTRSARAVRLYRSGHDLATVFELLGPASTRPELVDLTAGATVTGSAPTVDELPELPQSPSDVAGTFRRVGGGPGGEIVWSWGRAALVSQVTLGAAVSPGGGTARVVVELRTAFGEWRQLVAVAGAVGDGGAEPFVLARLPQPVAATAVRVTVVGQAGADVHDLHVLGVGGPRAP